MMAVTYSFLTLILCLLTGGGNDLLDYLPIEAYWKEKSVAVSVDAMVMELKPSKSEDVTASIAELGSPDAATRDAAAEKIRRVGGEAAMAPLTQAADSPDAEVRRRARTLLRELGQDKVKHGVRRLMAIRTLGEIGQPEAVAALKPLLQSKDLFEAEYAQAAIDAIEGRRADGARARGEVAPGVADDVWLLPRECRTVGQLMSQRGQPIGYAEFLAAAKAGDQGDAETVTHWVLALAERFGNLRIEAVTFGLVGNPTNPEAAEPAYLVVVVRGRYNSQWAKTLAKSERVAARDVQGVEVFEPDGESAWLMPSDELFVYLGSPAAEAMPVDQMVNAVKQGKGALAADDAMRKLVESVGAKQVLWAASAVTESQRTLPVAGVFDTITLLGTHEGKTLRLKMTARGRDAAAVAKAVDDVNKHAQTSAEFLSGIRGVTAIDLATQLLQSVQAEADGTSATLTAKLETTPAAVLSVPGLFDDGPEDEPEKPAAHPRLRKKD